MNDSAPELTAGVAVDVDILLDEVEVLMFRFVRLMGSRHDGDPPGTLTPPQYMVLRALASAGPMRVSEVAARLGVSNPAASMLLNTLTEAGLVDRSPDLDDRRATLVSVSGEGAERLAVAESTRRRFMERVASRLTPKEMRGLLRGLHELADAITEEKD